MSKRKSKKPSGLTKTTVTKRFDRIFAKTNGVISDIKEILKPITPRAIEVLRYTDPHEIRQYNLENPKIPLFKKKLIKYLKIGRSLHLASRKVIKYALPFISPNDKDALKSLLVCTENAVRENRLEDILNLCQEFHKKIVKIRHSTDLKKFPRWFDVLMFNNGLIYYYVLLEAKVNLAVNEWLKKFVP